MGLSVELKRKIHSVQSREANSVISMDEVRFHYNRSAPPVLDIEHLVINRGERVAVIGPSGAGKTTLLRLINGYVQPDSGDLKILGYNNGVTSNRPRSLNRRIGFIFQHFNLIDRATVLENVLWGRLGRVNPLLSLFGWFPQKDKKAARKAITEVNLTDQINQRADNLSGGQMQRVAIARVLAQEAEIILADEPISNLDPALADDILGLLSNVSQKHNVTLIMNVHQSQLAQRYADRIIGLRNGRVVYDNASHLLNSNDLRTIFEPEVKPSLIFNSNAKKDPSH